MTGPHKTHVMIDGQKVAQTYHEPVFPFDEERVTAIKAIVFDSEGQILGVKKGRTFDLLSGRREWEDDNFEEAASREAYEQASVILHKVTLAAVIEEALEVSGEEPTYTLVLAGNVQEIEPMFPKHEHKRAFIAKKNFLKRYRFGNPDDLKKLIDMAEFVNRKPETRRSKRKQRSGNR